MRKNYYTNYTFAFLPISLTEATTPPKLSNDAIAYLDMLFGPEGHPPGFTFKCCENCNGDIKTL